MYTIMPYRSNKEVTRRDSGWFSDPVLDRFFDMGSWFGSSAFRVDLKDKGESYELQAELPGVKQDDIDLSLKDDTLTISAEFKREENSDRHNYIYSERRTGKFVRSFDVSGIDQQGIAADYSDGVLTVTLPKVKPQEPVDNSRKIAIGNRNAEPKEG
ncbi:MAG: Hsp20/alpha crystallin family protein [Candidatus Fimadaptatus sp.]